jgi:tripartite-type tricarboxylate transporter receptor subunit TctC
MPLVRLLAQLSGCVLALASGLTFAGPTAAPLPSHTSTTAKAPVPATSSADAATGYPARPVQLVVPYAPGGALDVVGRILAESLSHWLGQPVVVINRPGANANIGPAVVAQAAPDGYTLLASSTATVVNPLIEKALNWKIADLVPVARFVQAPNIVVVPTSPKLESLADFVAHAKAHPDLTTSMTGPGTPQTLSTNAFAQSAGIRLIDVAYKGGVSYIPDLVSGRLAVSIAPLNVVLPLVQEGKLDALATTGDRRSTLLPQVPTLAESGYPEATGVSWYGVHAPAGTPAPVLEKLAKSIRSAADDPKVRERVAAVGAEVAYLEPSAFADFLDSEATRAKRFVAAGSPKAGQ